MLLDLPGFQKPFDSLTTRMQATVDAALSEVDAAMLVFNAAEELGGGDRFIAEAALASRIGLVSVLNKIDIVAPTAWCGCAWPRPRRWSAPAR